MKYSSKNSIAGLILFFTLGQTFSVAQNKDSKDEIFTDPKGSGVMQLILGITDAQIGAGLIRAGFRDGVDESIETDNKVRGLKDKIYNLQQEIRETGEAFSSEEARYAALKDANARLGPNGINPAVETEIREIKRKPVISSAKKVQKIEELGEKIAKLRATDIERSIAETTGIGANRFRVIKTLKVAGGILFLLDAVGRVYVWNSLDKSPTISPVGTIAWKLGQKTFGLGEKDEKTVEESTTSHGK